jgi:hypothetical protein
MTAADAPDDRGDPSKYLQPLACPRLRERAHRARRHPPQFAGSVRSSQTM